MAPPQTEIAHI